MKKGSYLFLVALFLFVSVMAVASRRTTSRFSKRVASSRSVQCKNSLVCRFVTSCVAEGHSKKFCKELLVTFHKLKWNKARKNNNWPLLPRARKCQAKGAAKGCRLMGVCVRASTCRIVKSCLKRKTRGSFCSAIVDLIRTLIRRDRMILNMAGHILSRSAGTALLRRFPSSGKCSPNMCRYRGQCVRQSVCRFIAGCKGKARSKKRRRFCDKIVTLFGLLKPKMYRKRKLRLKIRKIVERLHLVKKKTLKKQSKLKRIFNKLESVLSKARSRESMLRNGKKKLKRFKKIQRAKENIIKEKLQKLSRKLLFVDKKESKLIAKLNGKPRTHRLKGRWIVGKDKGKLRKKLKALLRAKRVGLKIVTFQKKAQKVIKYNLNRLIRKRLKIPPTQKKKLKALYKNIAKERSHLKRVRNAMKKTSKTLPLLTKKIASLIARLGGRKSGSFKRLKNKNKTVLRMKLKVLLHAKKIGLKVVTFQKKAQKKIKLILNRLILKKLKIPPTQKKKFKALAKKIAEEKRNLKRVRNAIRKTLKKLPLLIKKIALLKARLGGRKSGSSKRSRNHGKTLLRKKLKVLLHKKRIELEVATFQKKAQKRIKRNLNGLINKKRKVPPTQKKKLKALAKKIAKKRRNLKRVRKSIKKTLKKLPLLIKRIDLLKARLGGRKSGSYKRFRNKGKDKKLLLRKKLKVLLHAKRMELKIVSLQKRAQKKIKRNLNGLINKKRKVPSTQKKKFKALAKRIAKERRNLKRIRNAIKKASRKLTGLTQKIALLKALFRGRKSRGGSSKRTKDEKKTNKQRKRNLLIRTSRIRKRARTKMARLEKTLDKLDKGLATLARRKSKLRPGQKKLRIVLDKRIATITRQRKSKSQVMMFLGKKIARLSKRIARLKEGDVNSYKKKGGKNRLKKKLTKLRLSTKRILRKTIQLKAMLKKNNDRLADFLNQKSRLRPNQKKMKIELARTIALYRKKGKKIRLHLKKVSKKLSKMRRAMKKLKSVNRKIKKKNRGGKSKSGKVKKGGKKKRRLRKKLKKYISIQKRFSKKISQLKKQTKKLGKVISTLRKRKSRLRPRKKKKRIALGKKIASLTVKRKRIVAKMKKVSGKAAKLKTAIQALRAKLAGKPRSASPPLATNLRGRAEPRIDAVVRPTEITKRRTGRSVENTESDRAGLKKDYTVGVHKSRHLNSLNLKTTGDEIVKSRRRNMDSDSKETAAEAERGTKTSQSDESARRLPESPAAGSSSILDSRFKMFEEWKDAQERHEEGPFLLKLAKHNRQNLVRLGWTQKEDLRNFLMKLENELASTSPFSKTEEQKWRLFFLLTQRNIAVSIRHFEQRLALRLRSLGQPGKHRLEQVMGIIALGT